VGIDSSIDEVTTSEHAWRAQRGGRKKSRKNAMCSCLSEAEDVAGIVVGSVV